MRRWPDYVTPSRLIYTGLGGVVLGLWVAVFNMPGEQQAPTPTVDAELVRVRHPGGHGVVDVLVWQDAKRHATCWTTMSSGGVGITCIPNIQLRGNE